MTSHGVTGPRVPPWAAPVGTRFPGREDVEVQRAQTRFARSRTPTAAKRWPAGDVVPKPPARRSASRSAFLLSVLLVRPFSPSWHLPMAAADSWARIPSSLDAGSLAARVEASPGIAYPLSRLCLSDHGRAFPCTYRASKNCAASPRHVAPYPLPVCLAGALFRLLSDSRAHAKNKKRPEGRFLRHRRETSLFAVDDHVSNSRFDISI